jgi:hypothetical protein
MKQPSKPAKKPKRQLPKVAPRNWQHDRESVYNWDKHKRHH